MRREVNCKASSTCRYLSITSPSDFPRSCGAERTYPHHSNTTNTHEVINLNIQRRSLLEAHRNRPNSSKKPSSNLKSGLTGAYSSAQLGKRLTRSHSRRSLESRIPIIGHLRPLPSHSLRIIRVESRANVRRDSVRTLNLLRCVSKLPGRARSLCLY